MILALLGGLVAVLVWFWVQYLPAYYVSRLFVPEARGPERQALALLLGLALLPLGVFMLSVALRDPMDAPLLWTMGSLINLSALVVWGRRALFPDLDRRDLLVALAVFAGVSLFLLFGVRAYDAGDVLSTVQHCIYVIVLHTIANHPSEAIELVDAISGEPFYFLVNHDIEPFNGLAFLFQEQRPGNMAILAPPVALLGTLGWFVVGVHASMTTAYCAYLAARCVGTTVPAAVIGAALLVWAGHLFCGVIVNENFLALTLVAFAVWLSLREDNSLGHVMLLGLAAGHLVGVRYTSVMFWPAILLALVWQPTSWRQRGLVLLAGAATALLAAAPWLYVNYLMLGDMIGHPSLRDGQDPRNVVNHFFGYPFRFKALNWPFTERIIRTAWNPFPTALMIALWITKCFGQVLSAVGLVGIGLARRRALWLLLAFFLPHTMALGLIEAVDWEQLTYAAPSLVPLAVFVAIGVDGLLGRENRRRRAVTAACVLATLLGGSLALRSLDLPVDERTLDQRMWQTAPLPDAGTIAVAESLTAPSLLPRMPHLRGANARNTLPALETVVRPSKVDRMEGRPVYPSGSVVVLSASTGSAGVYDFVVQGGDLRQATTPVRSAVWLHMVSVRLPHERVRVHVQRFEDGYAVDLEPLGPAGDERDFTIYLNPWFPPISRVQLTLSGGHLDGLRTAEYGGSAEEGEALFMLTNYPPSVLDVVEVPYRIDPNGETTNCGIWVFFKDVDPTRIETLTPGGGHDLMWDGSLEGVLRLPSNMVADRLMLFSEPYCGAHIPQYGDRYALYEGPLPPPGPLELTLDQMWVP